MNCVAKKSPQIHKQTADVFIKNALRKLLNSDLIDLFD